MFIEFVRAIAITLLAACVVIGCTGWLIDDNPTGNSVCSDNAGVCLSSPPCVGEWPGTDCKIGAIEGLCKDTGNPAAPILTPCCSCSNE